MKAKKEWITEAIERNGSIAKLAFLSSKPVGLIQYKPRPEEKLVEIECIFVPMKEHLGKGDRKILAERSDGRCEIQTYSERRCSTCINHLCVRSSRMVSSTRVLHEDGIQGSERG